MINKIKVIISKVVQDELWSRVSKAVVYGIGGAVGSRILILITGIIISRLLGIEAYGKYSLVNSTVMTFVTFSGLGIGTTLTRYVALYQEDNEKLGELIKTLKTFCEIMSLIVSIIMLFYSDSISLWVNDDLQLSFYFKLTAFAIFVASVSAIEQSIMLGFEKYKRSAILQLVRCGIYFVLSIILTPLFHITGAIISLLAMHVVHWILSYLSNVQEYRIRSIKLKYKFSSDLFNILWKFAFPAFISALLVSPVTWLSSNILAKYAGFTDLAIFSTSLQWMTMVTYIPSQFGQIRPIYTNLYAKNKYTDIRKVFMNTTLLSSGIILPVALVAIIGGKIILGFYGDGYQSGYSIFVLMICTAIIINLQSQVGSLFQATGLMWTGFFLNAIWSMIILSVFYLLKNNGGIGLATAYLISYLVHFFLSLGVCLYMWRKWEKTEGSDLHI